MAASVAHAAVGRRFTAKHAMWVVFGLLIIVVWLTRDNQLLIANSQLRQRYAPVSWIVALHGIPGALALFLGIFQFSSRLRQRYLTVHRAMGRIYVGCVAIAAPSAIVVSLNLPTPTLLMASVIQSAGWLLATGTALYCVRQRKIQQHREWMMRSYPFAMVFICVRSLFAIPAIRNAGLVGREEVVWSCIAVAGVLPSFLIEWQKLAQARRATTLKAAVAAAAGR